MCVSSTSSKSSASSVSSRGADISASRLMPASALSTTRSLRSALTVNALLAPAKLITTDSALAPKMEEAVKKVLTEDPSKAEDIMKKAQAIAEAGAAGKIQEACDLSYKLAEELGVK